MILSYCVYVLFSHRDLKIYMGFTTHLEKRIIDHNDGKSTSTSKRRPLELIFCEFYLSKKDALRREKYLKTTAGKKGLRLMLKETLDIKLYNLLMFTDQYPEANQIWRSGQLT